MDLFLQPEWPSCGAIRSFGVHYSYRTDSCSIAVTHRELSCIEEKSLKQHCFQEGLHIQNHLYVNSLPYVFHSNMNWVTANSSCPIGEQSLLKERHFLQHRVLFQWELSVSAEWSCWIQPIISVEFWSVASGMNHNWTRLVLRKWKPKWSVHFYSQNCKITGTFPGQKKQPHQ